MGKFNLAESAFGATVSKLDTDKIRHIALDNLADNERNFYGLREIEKLADSIREVGLLDPVAAVPVGDGYRLISGHRRLAAYRLLAEEDREKYGAIPTRVVAAMDDLRETLALVTANSTARELTYAEKLRQEQVLRETLTAMKEAGMDVPRNLGTYMAEQLGTSRNEVSRMHSVNENLIPEAREKVDSGELNARQAYDLSRQPEEKQRDAIGSLKKIVRGDLSEIKPPETDCGKVFRDALVWARAALPAWAKHAVFGATRHDSIEYMRDRQGNSAYWSDEPSEYTATGKSKPVRLDHYGVEVTWTELWDALALAALEYVANAPLPGQTEIRAELWHTEDPTEKDSYVCMYENPSGSKSVGLFDWRGEWHKYGQPVGETYKVIKWTEVPK